MSRFVASFFVVCLALAGCNNTTPVSPDTGLAGTDAATTPDAGHDAAMATTDTGPLPDTGPVVCPDTFGGTTALEDHTADTMVTMTVTGTIGSFAYSPNRIRIHTGTMVTIPGGGIHPLMQATCSAAGGPTITSAGGTFTFTTPGLYGYYCGNHGSNTGTGMAALIVVE